MICPTCKSDMIVVEHDRIELDYCTRCHGVWFDAGELELLLEIRELESPDLFLSNILNSPEADSAERKRKCPICGRKMKKVTIGEEPKILIDACDREHGIWFDSGEVKLLLKQLADKAPPKHGSPQQVISFIEDVFEATD